jgi:hypothetical protein
MSESTIPFQGQTAVLDRPVTNLEDPIGEPTGNGTKLLALGGLATVLVLGILAYFLFFAGGEAPVADSGPTAGAIPPAAEDAPVAEPVKQPRLTNRTFGRDPYKALITPPVEAADAAPVGSAVTDTSLTGSTSTDTATSTDASAGGAADTTTSPTASQSHSFKVVDVAPDNSRITVKVDGQFYRNLKAGEVFAKYFKVVLISGAVNSFQFGDDKFNVIGTKKLTIA